MKWLELLSKFLIQYSVQSQQIQAAPEKIKGMSIQVAVYFVGLVFFVTLGLASIILIFIDLGHQWDSEVPTHFSGTIGASFWMMGLGALGFAICVGVARYLARKKQTTLPAEPGASGPSQSEILNPLLLFGEEFLAQLISKLK